MKIVFPIARVLLGLVFTVFGLNGFLNFIPAEPLPTGPASQYIGALSQSHYMTVVFALQLIAGILLLLNRYVPLALTVLAPVIVNIVLFHASMAPSGLPLAAVTVILWLIVAYQFRHIFGGLLQHHAEPRL